MVNQHDNSNHQILLYNLIRQVHLNEQVIQSFVDFSLHNLDYEVLNGNQQMKMLHLIF